LSRIESSKSCIEIVYVFLSRARLDPERLQDLVDRDRNASTTAPQGVHDLVAGNGRNPSSHRSTLCPGASLQVQRQENFLHHVVRVEAGSAGAPAHGIPKRDG